MEPAHLVQLPFPSTAAPNAALAAYYETYAERYREEVAGYFVPSGDLWEMPLWVAHLSGMLDALGVEHGLIDLSKTTATSDASIEAIAAVARPGAWLLFSPLAQNFSLALDISRALLARGFRTMIGGNMAPLAAQADATSIVRGIATPESLAEALRGEAAPRTRTARRGTVGWTPRYDLLSGFATRVPLLRLNASHGCLYACAFCGDSWSRKLYVVERGALAAEVDRLHELFPQTRLVYVGDKTFGQSPEAVQNLLDVFGTRPGYRFIVQTHVAAVDDALIEAMLRLGVEIVELGFEAGDEQALHEVGKAYGRERLRAVLRRLRAAGLRVVLNVLGGLPGERPESHAKTLRFVEECDDVWLYNLYNFVPYPLTPMFPLLRERIFDWDFAHWREDAPPVFEPYHLSAQESWELFLETVECAHRAVRVGSAV